MCNILFLHAILISCDTTSRIHGVGKRVALKNFEGNKNFPQQVSVFTDSQSTQQDVILAGERAIIRLSGGKQMTA